MPYINPARKKALKDGGKIVSPGELNYALTCAIMHYMKVNGLCYSSINGVIGALEGAKLEFYRRVAVPYEEKKLKENGDVYLPELLSNIEEEFDAK